MPKASIIIPAYNAEAFIQATLESVFAQTFQDFECIIIDDGSTDSTASVAKSFSDSRLQYYYIDNSGGPARPRNIGIQKAMGEFIFLFDSDDIMHPQKLEFSIRAFQQHPEADFIFTNYCSINEVGFLLKENYLDEYDSFWGLLPDLRKKDVQLIESTMLYPALVKINFIGTSSVSLRKSSLSTLDQFNEQLNNSDDRLFLTKFSKQHHGVFVNKFLHSYRISSGGISNRDFSERGIGKIEALKLIKSDCTDINLKKQVNYQIANNYASMAYTYKSKNLYRLQLVNACKSIGYCYNWWAVKLAIHALFCTAINAVSRGSQLGK